MESKIDMLGRREFIGRLISLITQITNEKKGCTFAIDGEWGTGKSFALEVFEEQIEQIQSEETADNRYFVFHYNCWKYDYYEEPSIAIVSAMLDKAEEENSILSSKVDGAVKDSWKFVQDKLEEVAGKFIENKIGINLVEVIKEVQGNGAERTETRNEFDSLFTFKKTLEETRKQLKEITERKSVIVVVDELDRCLPAYAIKVLERLHHLFNEIDNVVVIIAIDSTQLENSIRQIYGNSTNVETYLKKFISFTVKLEKGSLCGDFFEKYDNYVSKFISPTQNDEKFISDLVIQIFSGIDIRTQEKLIEKAQIIHSIVCAEPIDICILCYEIMWMVLAYKTKSSKLQWITAINNVIYANLQESLGQEQLGYIMELENKVGNGNTIKYNHEDYKKLGNSLVDRIFWCFSSIYNLPNVNISGKYYRESSLFNEVDTAYKFNELAKIIE